MHWQSNGPEGAVLREVASRILVDRVRNFDTNELMRILSCTVPTQELATMVHRLQRRTAGLGDLWEEFARVHEGGNADPHSKDPQLLLQFICIAIASKPERVMNLKGPYQPFMLVVLEVARAALRKAAEPSSLKDPETVAAPRVQSRLAHGHLRAGAPKEAQVTGMVCDSLSAVLARDAHHAPHRLKHEGTRSVSLASKSTASSNDSTTHENCTAPHSGVQCLQDGYWENPEGCIGVGTAQQFDSVATWLCPEAAEDLLAQGAINSSAALWLGPEPEPTTESPGNSPGCRSGYEQPAAFDVPTDRKSVV